MAFGTTQSKDQEENRQIWNYVYTLEKKLRYALSHIDGDNITPGTVDSKALAAGAIQGKNLADGAISSVVAGDRITAERITAEVLKVIESSMKKATIDSLQAATARIVETEIGRANIDWASINTLVAEVARIADAEITTGNIEWADIQNLTATIANIANTQIGTADIDWAHIKDMITEQAIITAGEAGELYIARLGVTEANMVYLTVGELVVRGEDGTFYSVSVDENGSVVAERKWVGNDDIEDADPNIEGSGINGGQKIIAESITAEKLNVKDIFADSSIIRRMIAENLDVDTLFAREGTIHKLNTIDITGNESISLYVEGQKQFQTYVRITEDGLQIGEVGSAEMFRANNHTLEVTNIKTERLGITQAMNQDEDWAWLATNTGLGLKYIGPPV